MVLESCATEDYVRTPCTLVLSRCCCATQETRGSVSRGNHARARHVEESRPPVTMGKELRGPSSFSRGGGACCSTLPGGCVTAHSPTCHRSEPHPVPAPLLPGGLPAASPALNHAEPAAPSTSNHQATAELSNQRHRPQMSVPVAPLGDPRATSGRRKERGCKATSRAAAGRDLA